MNEYNDSIKRLPHISFNGIRRIACDCLVTLSKDVRDNLWKELNHGCALLNSHELLCQYLYSFGNMHKAKIENALLSINNPHQVFNNDFSIIDWGCGQGLATVCFFDFLNVNKIPNKVRKVILIEPSPMALERAGFHVNAYLNDENKIKTIKKFLNEVEKSEIKTDQPVTLHFFSNILDIKEIDLKQLAQKVGENVLGEHYFFCIGPLNRENYRIDVFYNYFNSPFVLSEIEKSENKLEIIDQGEYKDIQRSYTLKLKVFKFERNNNY